MYNIELYHHIHTKYDLDDNYNIDSSISQLNVSNVNTDYNSENGQTDQLAIFNSTLDQRTHFNRSQWNQFSIKARNTWDLIDGTDKILIRSFLYQLR